VAECSAFAGCEATLAADQQAIARPIEPLSVVSVTAWRGQAAELAEVARARLGLELPTAGRWRDQAGLTAAWAGPGHWWLQRPGRVPLLRELAPLAAHGGLIDISDAHAVLRISGPAARDILLGLLPLDLHPRAFGPGHVATTIAAHITVRVRQIDDAPSYDLACPRSYAASLWRALALAGAGPPRRFGQARTPP
jgi:sarcosine oxidase subunit gamma